MSHEFLAPYAWEHRPVLIFTPSLKDQKYQAQYKEFMQEQNALTDRQMVLITITPDTINMWPDDTEKPVTDSQNLYDYYTIEPDSFTVLLIGKDTNEKKRVAEPTAPSKFFSLIDTMPMRQEEMEASG